MTPDVLHGRFRLLTGALRDLADAHPGVSTEADDALLDFFDALGVLEEPEAIERLPASFLAAVFSLARVLGEVTPQTPPVERDAFFDQARALARRGLLAMPLGLTGAADAAE